MAELDEIESFLAIARLGSFTVASRELGRSQPAVSRRIRQLEGAVGAPLFVRSGRDLSLSAAGRAFLPHAEAAVAAVRDGRRAAREVAQQKESHSLRLAIVGTLADSHLVDALRAFEAAFDEVSVELATATSREVSERVRTGDADLGLRYFEDGDPKLESLEIGTEDLVLVVPSAHPLRARRVRSLRKLAAERWLGFAPERGQPDSLGHLLDRTLAEIGVPEPRYMAIDSLTAQKRLVEAGLGVALMPRSSVREEVRIGSLRAVDVLGARLAQPVCVVRRRAGHRGELAAAFVDVLRDYTPGLQPSKRARSSRRTTSGVSSVTK